MEKMRKTPRHLRALNNRQEQSPKSSFALVDDFAVFEVKTKVF